jgi:hypothetical protein
VGIRLAGIRVFSSENRAQYQTFAAGQMSLQMDVVHGLFESGERFAVDLRYLFDPGKPHLLEIYFLLRVCERGDRPARGKAAGLGEYLATLLRVNNELHDFDPVSDAEELERLVTPFGFQHVVEICRREDIIGLSDWNAYLRLLVDGSESAPFDIRTVLPQIAPMPGAVDSIRESSRKKYGKHRDHVEKEIREAWSLDPI